MAEATSSNALILEIELLIQGTTNDPPPMPKIFKVDDRLRKVKTEDYEPSLIAIGPIHRGKEHLKMMEQHKLRYLQKLLKKCQKTERCQTCQETQGCQGTERCQVTPTIDRLIGKLREMQKEARLCYPTDDLKLDGDNFIKMLLLDGCFIIELVRKYFGIGSTEENDPVLKSETLSQIRHDLMLVENQLPLFVLNQLFEMTKSNDPDDNLWYLVKNLVSDMFPWPDVLKSRSTSVMSDQLAGFDHLLGLTYQCFSPFSTISGSSTITRGGMPTSSSTPPLGEPREMPTSMSTPPLEEPRGMQTSPSIPPVGEPRGMPTPISTLPLQDLKATSGVRIDVGEPSGMPISASTPPPQHPEATSTSTALSQNHTSKHPQIEISANGTGSKGDIHINSASELKEAGIRFKPSKDNSLTFKNKVLKLPPFQVSGKTESVLRNLMAYEQLRPNNRHHPKHVTDYIFFMDCLIRSIKDVKVLRRSGVLGNYLGGDDKVYHMLDRLVTNFYLSSEFCHSDVFDKLNNHCGDLHEKRMARLWRDYFNSPWSLISFFAAVVLLGISITQLTFTILTYKHQTRIWSRQR